MGDLLKGFYKTAVGCWGISPSEFWDLTPLEWWWLHEAKMDVQGKPATAQSIRDELQELEDFAAEHGETYRYLKHG